MNNELHSRKYLTDFRKELRNNATKAESMLWKVLQKRQLEGRKFRRQHSIGNYIVDFFCPSEKLIIELDGEGHNNAFNNTYDDLRSQNLQKLGFKVLRFENKLVFEQTDIILEVIVQSYKK